MLEWKAVGETDGKISMKSHTRRGRYRRLGGNGRRGDQGALTSHHDAAFLDRGEGIMMGKLAGQEHIHVEASK